MNITSKPKRQGVFVSVSEISRSSSRFGCLRGCDWLSVWSSHESHPWRKQREEHHQPTYLPIRLCIYSSFWATAENNGLIKKRKEQSDFAACYQVCPTPLFWNRWCVCDAEVKRGLVAAFSVIEHPCSLVDTEEERWDVHNIKTQWFIWGSDDYIKIIFTRKSFYLSRLYINPAACFCAQ